MIKLIKVDFSNCIKNIKFKVAISIMFAIVILQFYENCINFFGKTSLDLIDTGKLSMITSSSTIKVLFLSAISLIVFSIYSDSFLYEYQRGITNYYFIRVSKNKYIKSKIITVFFVVFFSLLIPLIINEILTVIALPSFGVKTISNRPIYEVINFKDKFFISNLYEKNKYLYNIFLIILISLYGSMIAVIGFNISLFLKKSKQILLYVYVFLAVNIFQIILPPKFIIERYIQLSNGKFSDFIITFFVWILIIIISSILAIKKVKRV